MIRDEDLAKLQVAHLYVTGTCDLPLGSVAIASSGGEQSLVSD